MRNTPAWEKISSDNHKYFKEALRCFNNRYQKYITAFNMGTGCSSLISKLRFDEFLRACSDDICRYSTYHPLEQRDRIIESVRASYMVKWLMLFKPLLLDVYSTLAPPDKTLFYVSSENQEAAVHFYRKSNELFAVFLASYVLGIHSVDSGDVDSVEDAFALTDLMDINIDGNFDQERREIHDFFYTLRYRIPHQDVYRPIFRRIEAMLKAA